MECSFRADRSRVMLRLRIRKGAVAGPMHSKIRSAHVRGESLGQIERAGGTGSDGVAGDIAAFAEDAEFAQVLVIGLKRVIGDGGGSSLSPAGTQFLHDGAGRLRRVLQHHEPFAEIVLRDVTPLEEADAKDALRDESRRLLAFNR